MPLTFTKMHGIGNDYVFVGLFDQSVADPVYLARAVSDRHRGIGSDGLVLVAPPDGPEAHVRMEMYNADGSRAQMCGNGIRCVAKLAYERGWARQNPLRVATDAGVKSLELTLDDGGRVAAVCVDMGPPILDAQRIPVATTLDRVVSMPLSLGDATLEVTCVSMGNPHAVFFTDLLSDVPLDDWGPRIERHSLFPERINVHFVQVVDARRVRMVSWERGSGRTMACGTGACAVGVAGVLCGKTERSITAELPGGELQIEWDEPSNRVRMTGAATEVFVGQWRA